MLKCVHVKSVGNLAISFTLLTALCGGKSSFAEPPKQNAASAQALQKAQGMLRQLSQEKVSLQAENTGLKERLKQLETEANKLAPLQAELEQYRANLLNAQNANAGLQNSMQAQAGRAAEKEQLLHQKLQETVAQAKLIQNDNQLLVAAVQEREQWIKQCAEKNLKLVEVNQELVGKFQQKGFWDMVANVEPLTGIGKVETQNTAQEYQFKLDDLKTVSFTSAAGGQ
jgi:hypothetical protein